MSVIEPMGSYLALVLVTAMQGDLAVDDTSVDSAGELTKPAFPWWETAMRHQGFQVLLGSSPAESTLVSLGAIRRKNRQMKELSDDLLHHRNAQKPCRWEH